MKVYTRREALTYAEGKQCRLEAVYPRPIGSRVSAARRVPRGGILVREDDGYIALELVARRVRIRIQEQPR